MSEEAKVDYLFRGLKPTLLEKIWIVSPKTSAYFFAALKLHTEALELAIRPNWAISVLGAAKGGTTHKKKAKDKLRESVLESKAEIAELKRASKSSASSVKREGVRSPQNSVSFESRTSEGKPIFHRCGKEGHIAHYCEAGKGNDKKKEPLPHRQDGGQNDQQEDRRQCQRDERRDDRRYGSWNDRRED